MESHRQLIITGMHRCGTSFIASWFQASGLFIGDELAGATPSNVRGHFEDLDFLELHEDLLRYNDTSMYIHEDKELIYADEHESRAISLCANRNNRFEEWGWKQPRATLFLEFWTRIIPSAYYLIPVRHPLTVINSILRREANKCLLRNDEVTGPIKHAEYMAKVAEHTDRYDRMYVLHCQRIINFAEQHGTHRLVVIDFDKIMEMSSVLASKLTNWGFEFTLRPYDEMFETKLLIRSDNHLIEKDAISDRSIELHTRLLELVN